jgi:hypothetical protein
LLPSLGWLPSYRRAWLLTDILAVVVVFGVWFSGVGAAPRFPVLARFVDKL